VVVGVIDHSRELLLKAHAGPGVLRSHMAVVGADHR